MQKIRFQTDLQFRKKLKTNTRTEFLLLTFPFARFYCLLYSKEVKGKVASGQTVVIFVGED